MADPDELPALRAENARLIKLLDAHGIEWRERVLPVVAADTRGADRPLLRTEASSPQPPQVRLSPAEKVALFGRLFKGRTDVFPVRWESKTSGKSGYAPACANEWRPGVCEKPRIKCSECRHRELIPLSDAVLYSHLAGELTAGLYPLLPDDSCHLVAVDFDDEDWRSDALAFRRSCEALGVPVSVEVSRSGNGAHAWIFFSGRVSAREARRLATAVISHACASTRQLALTSYDRLFPNQDTMPKGGFGNLIALPLQKMPREAGNSVFVDQDWRPYDDQWAYLAGVDRMAVQDIEPTVLRATAGGHPLDVTFVEEEDLREPWKRRSADDDRLKGTLPSSLDITLSNLVYFEQAQLPQSLANRLVRLAAFQNPDFYKAQAMRMSVWDKPRVIGCAQNFPNHIALPRGCLEPALQLLRDNGIAANVREERTGGQPIQVRFAGALRQDQSNAAEALLKSDSGVLCAPTAFGKTVVASAIIARRAVSTLVLVHRTELLRQWQQSLESFLGVDGKTVGIIGGGKDKPTGIIDVAVMQSLSRKGEVDARVEQYGQVIVDECHHIGAVSFDAILRAAKARFVLGLTATPIRRDGQQPIIFMQCGPIRHQAGRPIGAPSDLVVVPRFMPRPIGLAADVPVQSLFKHLASDSERTAAIVEEVVAAVAEGRKALVLTERTEHLAAIAQMLAGRASPLFVMQGRMSSKQRAAVQAQLDALPPDAPRVLLATGKLVGEGFDHPPLDTLILAMPVSWKGTLQQYVGRLHRAHAGKSEVRVVDVIDLGHPMLERMWERRQKGYRSLGYVLKTSADSTQGELTAQGFAAG